MVDAKATQTDPAPPREYALITLHRICDGLNFSVLWLRKWASSMPMTSFGSLPGVVLFCRVSSIFPYIDRRSSSPLNRGPSVLAPIHAIHVPNLIFVAMRQQEALTGSSFMGDSSVRICFPLLGGSTSFCIWMTLHLLGLLSRHLRIDLS